MVSNRFQFTQELLKEPFLSEEYHERMRALALTKKKSQSVTVGSAITSDECSSFTTLFRLFVYSMLHTQKVMPQIVLIYYGTRPTIWDDFRFISCYPAIWSLASKVNAEATRNLGLFNFCAKVQAVQMCSTRFSCWMDADLVFTQSVIEHMTKTQFAQKRGRVAGGFYCLEEKDKSPLYAHLLKRASNKLSSQIKKKRNGTEVVHPPGSIGSDQKELLKALKQANIQYTDCSQLYQDSCVHFTRKMAAKQEGRDLFLKEVRKILGE